MLFDEGVLLLKYWFHVTRDKQRKRLKQAGEKPEAPYGKFVRVSETFLRARRRLQALQDHARGLAQA